MLLTDIIKQIIKYSFAILVGLLMVIDWQWFWLAPDTAPYLVGIPLLVFYGLFAFFSKTSRFLRPLMLLMTILFFLINSLAIYFGMPDLVTSVDCKGKTYSIINYPAPLDWSFYDWTTWNGLFDYHSSFLGYNLSYYSSKLACDKNTNGVLVFIGSSVLIQSYGTQNSIYQMEYKMEARDSINAIEYSLYSYGENDVKKYLATTCKPNVPDTCKFTQIEHSSLTSVDEWASFIVDRKTGHVDILFDDNHSMVYTDLHNKSQKVKLVASYTPYIAPDQIYAGKDYGVLSYPTDHAFAYIFYRCDDLISHDPSECDNIPFSYTTPDDEDASLDFDKTSDHLTLSIGGKLVFTYNHPFKH